MSDPNTEFTNMVKNKKYLPIIERFKDQPQPQQAPLSKLDKNKFENMVKNKKDLPILERFKLANIDPSKQPKRIRSKLDKNKLENLVTNVMDRLTQIKKKMRTIT